MDPNATLAELLTLTDEAADTGEADVARITELVYALDAWLQNGGFLPQRWQRADRSACSQCGPGHADADGRCERHGKPVMP